MTELSNPFQPYNELIAAILSNLQAFGLKPQDLSADAFRGRFTIPDGQSPHELFEHTITWLRDEGIVRFEDYYSGTEDEVTAVDVVLTAKALQYLQAPLDALSGETPGNVLARSKSGDSSVSNWIGSAPFWEVACAGSQSR